MSWWPFGKSIPESVPIIFETYDDMVGKYTKDGVVDYEAMLTAWRDGKQTMYLWTFNRMVVEILLHLLRTRC